MDAEDVRVEHGLDANRVIGVANQTLPLHMFRVRTVEDVDDAVTLEGGAEGQRLRMSAGRREVSGNAALLQRTAFLMYTHGSSRTR